MVHISVIEAKLSQLGVRSSRWSRPEIRELQHILVDGEEIISLANGRYFAGFATMVATNIRVLIIDKRPFFMTYEDIRYDMISELDYTGRLLDATLHIFTINKQHRFTSMRHREHLKRVTQYIQQRVMEIRQHQVQAPVSTPMLATVQQQPGPPNPMPQPPEPPQPHTDPPEIPVASPQKNYRHMASRLSGRVLGPVAVQAAHHWPNVPNPYTKASLMVRQSESWLRSHTPHPELPEPLIQPEL